MDVLLQREMEELEGNCDPKVVDRYYHESTAIEAKVETLLHFWKPDSYELA